MSTYHPHPSTVAHRALLHLAQQPDGTRLPASVLADALGVAAKDIRGYMQTSLDRGLVEQEAGPDGIKRWYIASLTVAVYYRNLPENADTAQPPDPPSTPPAARKPRQVDAAAAPTTPFSAALWTDGRLMIHQGGQQMELGVEEVRVLVGYLERMAA